MIHPRVPTYISMATAVSSQRANRGSAISDARRQDWYTLAVAPPHFPCLPAAGQCCIIPSAQDEHAAADRATPCSYHVHTNLMFRHIT